MNLKGKIVLGTLVQLVLPVMAGNINYDVPTTHNWWWTAPETPEVKVTAANRTDEKLSDNVELIITTDKHEPLQKFSQKVNLAAGDSTELTFSLNVAPGFYSCIVNSNGAEVKKFNIGYEPENIVSLPDNQPDLKEFWDKARAELATVAPQYSMTLDKEKSNKVRNVYVVKMRSLGNEEIQGYLTVPVKKGKYPALIYYMGYGSKPWYPHPDSYPGWVEFVLSCRGQALNESTNKYGDWIVNGLDNKDHYYYRGAFMDLVRAIDFVTQLPQVDTRNVFAEGGSQGGAFTLAAAALDNRLTAAAPWIPFLSDYPDYFKIVHWPAEPILKKQKELNISDADLYKTLSYFDIKNLARWIKCPVLMGIGLQDPVCPPHTNFSGYNLIRSPKEYRIYTECGHDVRHPEWETDRTAFFNKYMRK